MTETAGVGAAGLLSALNLRIEYQARVAKLLQEAVNMEGELALQLIQAVATNPDVGANLDIRG